MDVKTDTIYQTYKRYPPHHRFHSQMIRFHRELIEQTMTKKLMKLWTKIDVNYPILSHKIGFRLDSINSQRLMKKYNFRSFPEYIFSLIKKDIDLNCFVCGYPIMSYNEMICHHIDYTSSSVLNDGLTVLVHRDCHSGAWQFNNRPVSKGKIHDHEEFLKRLDFSISV